jgi:hypothetical protein
MSRMLDPQMCFRLEQLSVAEGWRCLDVGAGNGSISHWLTDKVGPKGYPDRRWSTEQPKETCACVSQFTRACFEAF